MSRKKQENHAKGLVTSVYFELAHINIHFTFIFNIIFYVM